MKTMKNIFPVITLSLKMAIFENPTIEIWFTPVLTKRHNIPINKNVYHYIRQALVFEIWDSKQVCPLSNLRGPLQQNPICQNYFENTGISFNSYPLILFLSDNRYCFQKF